MIICIMNIYTILVLHTRQSDKGRQSVNIATYDGTHITSVFMGEEWNMVKPTHHC